MQLTTHTDYALRALLILGISAPGKLTAGEISRAYGVSENHMIKVLRRLAELGYVETLRGKDGGARLSADPQHINLGQVVREVERDLGVVACLRRTGEGCVITPVCGLKGILAEASERFLETLGQYTLADVLETSGGAGRLLGIRPPAAHGSPSGRHLWNP
jgi:Rrf2 family transcriptional regulator, nitric oxide-sensitive transcriptional repressor